MIHSPQFEHLQLVVENQVATISLDRAGGVNAFSTAMYREIRAAIRIADSAGDVSCILLRSAKRDFGVGGDLHEMRELLDNGQDVDLYRFRDDLPYAALRSTRKPTVAAVDGLCVGGGLGIATSCDIVLVGDSARFGVPEVKMGLIDGLAASTLFGHIPRSALNYLLFSGKLIDAREAVRIGLALECVPGAELQARARELAHDVSSTSASAIEQYKRIIRGYERLDNLDDVAELIVKSPEVRARLNDFHARRSE
ncbi:enoyl-CoA hydratase/isomerase family protein [Sciscionella marina]|uniref:enoyl-CoA hydratase/isomerase family protein n=1 Tax=Sciscionella marina TaxID=508770 RepID=UPI000370B702|nr:enoyl-CoA hydratase/isomerase family protein [Sciscionella marina]